ncbi:MAG: right-handed parallel beta-helix repeat-containing protein [Saprospiraceae bacterium]|nr:right-handed parallel beta-helix repeat-containing protein [Saprospiraceae bacterium]
MRKIWFLVLWPCLCHALQAQTPELPLTKGMHITSSCRIRPGEYLLTADSASEMVVCTIQGNDLEVDFQNAELRGAAEGVLPDHFTGYGLVVMGNNIRIKNARIRGFKVAVYAENAGRLTLENCDVSYNFRSRLLSTRLKEDESDWLSYHHNEADEWLRYGAGIYLKNCPEATVRGCRATGNQNALLLSGCNDGLMYNNSFQFNSGLGIGLYRSSRNRIMHNLLDWNVRGYSHRVYARGQDSAGILLYEQSSGNTIAYNSATHSGDGLFLWAGQSTMDSGEGGCNDNVIFGNDFSHAPTNGVEVTFSRNRIQGNIIRECTYGIWGGYSYGSRILGNYLADCRTGIAIEHGQHDTIRQNLFQDDSVGIRLWAREQQPADWGYSQHRDVRSLGHSIDRNVFIAVRKPLSISASQNVSINGENLFLEFDKLLETPKPNDSLRFLRNDIYGNTAQIAAVWQNPVLASFKGLNFTHPGQPQNPYAPLDIPYGELHEPDSLPGGMLAVLPDGFPRGRRFIIMGEWGPFDFSRPIAAVDTLAGRQYALVLVGPSGDWKITESKGVKNVSTMKGRVPAQLTFEREPGAPTCLIRFEYSSPKTIVTEFGKKIPPGERYMFTFTE